VLRAKFFSSEEVAAIVRDYRTAGLSEPEVALMALAEKVVRSAHRVTREDIDALRRYGFSDEQILDTILTAASRSFFSKVVDATGFRPTDAWLKGKEELLGTDAFRVLMVGRSYETSESD
jgi:alkylhydroperoxidase family enzyme